MTNSLMGFKGMMKNTALILCLMFGAQTAFAESSKDSDVIEEVERFTDESSKMREDHIKEMRELHLKHVNEIYDRKLAHNTEMTALWKQLKAGDKASNKALREQIKAKHKAFKEESKKFREDFHDNVLKKKHAEFRELMKGRKKEMKGKFKE